jgi:2-polyprenyl-3-methyl-5-hydroxy-6-metoxy-1,4-benzoquinol methylase
MNEELARQNRFWNEEIGSFDSIYSHQKSKLSNLLDSVFRWDMYARFNYTLEHAEPIEGATFLDVGCGTGRYSLEFARRGARLVVGLDIAERMVEVCSDRARSEGLAAKTSFHQTDLAAFKPEQSFDVAIGIGLFDYIRDPLPVLAKMRESITDRAIVSFPRLWTWRAPVRKARLAVKGCDVYFYTVSDIDRLMKAAGFARYEIKSVGQLHCVTAFAR